MIARLHAARASLRIARRDAWRSKGRSALVVAMIGLPVMGVTTIDVIAHTSQPTQRQAILASIGSADALVHPQDQGSRVRQAPDGVGWSSTGPDDRAPSGPPGAHPVDALAVLPPGSRVISDRTTGVRVRTPAGVTRATMREVDLRDPLAAGLLDVAGGRPAATTREVAVTGHLAHTAGLRVGSTLTTVGPAATFTVVGILNDVDLRLDEVVALPGAYQHLLPEVPGDQPMLRASIPGGVTWPDVQRWNDEGLVVVARDVVADPPPRSQVPYYQDQARFAGSSSTRDQVFAGIVVAAGMAVLEVVLLAGPAFAVGARRSRRQLGLLGATGADRRHLRDTVLGGGLVLGLVGAVAGSALGIGLAHALRPFVEHWSGTRWTAFDYRWRDLVFISLVGVLTGVAAAVVPARSAARQDVVAALTGRRERVRTRRRVPVAGIVLALLGLGVTVLGGREAKAAVVVAGTALGEIGLIVLTPTILGLLGRGGRLLPLAPRMALRDAVRNRTRSASAVAAIMAAVAGSVAAGIYVSSLDQHDRRQYVAQVPVGDVSVSFDREGTAVTQAEAATLRDAAARALPTRDALVVEGAGDPADLLQPVMPVASQCPLYLPDAPPRTRARIAAAERDPRCYNGRVSATSTASFSQYPFLVDDGSVLAAFVGPSKAATVRAVLARGGVVVFDPLWLDHGRVSVGTSQDDGSTRDAVSFDAAVVRTDQAMPAEVVLSPAAAARLHLTPTPTGVLVTTTRLPTDAELQAAQAAVDASPVDSIVNVERGYDGNYGAGLLALLVGAVVVALGAALIASGLASADSRPDLATLAAVGAAPRTRRLLAAAQAATTAVIGTVLGVAAGFVPAVAVVSALARRPSGVVGPYTSLWQLTVPWTHVVVTLVAIPLLAGLTAGLVTRSRLPMVSRLT